VRNGRPGISSHPWHGTEVVNGAACTVLPVLRRRSRSARQRQSHSPFVARSRPPPRAPLRRDQRQAAQSAGRTRTGQKDTARSHHWSGMNAHLFHRSVACTPRLAWRCVTVSSRFSRDSSAKECISAAYQFCWIKILMLRPHKFVRGSN
jgi:hypothetical protein